MLALDSGFAVAVKLCFICVERALQLADFTVQSKTIKVTEILQSKWKKCIRMQIYPARISL